MYELKRVIVGQDAMLERLLVALLAGGHVLLEGVPGLAKTLTVKTLAAVLGGSFRRVQFTPDLVPSDLVGTRVYRPDTGRFDTELGPVFGNFLLADEINRAPAKVQSALLEVMQERQVTIGGETHPMPSPFLVMATQNPIESEGTYPAARGAGRPLPVQAPRRLPDGGRGGRGGRPRDRRAGAGARAPLRGRPGAPPRCGAARVRGPRGDRLRRRARRRHAPPGPLRAPRPRAADRVRRQPARADRPDPGRPGPRAPARARARGQRGRVGPRRRRPAPPARADLRRAGRRRRARRRARAHPRHRAARSGPRRWRRERRARRPARRAGPRGHARCARRGARPGARAPRGGRPAGGAAGRRARHRHRAGADPALPGRRRRPPARRRGERAHGHPARARARARADADDVGAARRLRVDGVRHRRRG